MHSAVHLNFSCHVVLVSRRAVVATFERAIHTFGRPVDPQVESGAHQVCVWRGGGEGGKEGGGATLGGRSGARIQVFAGYWCGANIDVPLL